MIWPGEARSRFPANDGSWEGRRRASPGRVYRLLNQIDGKANNRSPDRVICGDLTVRREINKRRSLTGSPKNRMPVDSDSQRIGRDTDRVKVRSGPGKSHGVVAAIPIGGSPLAVVTKPLDGEIEHVPAFVVDGNLLNWSHASLLPELAFLDVSFTAKHRGSSAPARLVLPHRPSTLLASSHVIHHISGRSSAGFVHTRDTNRPIGVRLGCCRLILMSTAPCWSAELVEAPSPTGAPRATCPRCQRSRHSRI